MMVSIMTVQNGYDGRNVYDEADYVGPPAKVARLIAELHGQNQAMVNARIIRSFTIVYALIANNGNVEVHS